MSKQSEAKAVQAYTTHTNNCENCKHLTFDKKLPAWMIGIERYESNFDRYSVEANARCGIGQFAVKKTASCLMHEGKEK